MYNTIDYRLRDEAATDDQTFQPYGQILVMDVRSTNKKLAMDSM